jgi:hypothetical protein
LLDSFFQAAGDAGDELGAPADEVVVVGVGGRSYATPRAGLIAISRVEDGGTQGAFGSLPAAEDRMSVAVAVTVGFVVGGSQAHGAFHVECVKADAGAVPDPEDERCASDAQRMQTA